MNSSLSRRRKIVDRRIVRRKIPDIWRGGCIIRAKLLDTIIAAYAADPDLPNLMLDPAVSAAVKDNVGSLRAVVQRAVGCGLPAGSEPGWGWGPDLGQFGSVWANLGQLGPGFGSREWVSGTGWALSLICKNLFLRSLPSTACANAKYASQCHANQIKPFALVGLFFLASRVTFYFISLLGAT